MTPQVHLDGTERAAPTMPESAPTPLGTQPTAQAPHALTYAERQGLAMGWVAIALGIFLLMGGLALWASAVFSAGFTGWLISVAVMGVVMVASLIAVSFFVIRPGR